MRLMENSGKAKTPRQFNVVCHWVRRWEGNFDGRVTMDGVNDKEILNCLGVFAFPEFSMSRIHGTTNTYLNNKQNCPNSRASTQQSSYTRDVMERHALFHLLSQTTTVVKNI